MTGLRPTLLKSPQLQTRMDMPSDNSQPLVSIICFCKDRVTLITRCIESVVNQTYRNIEFVVQDGASTDGTLELLLDYAMRDPRIKIVSEPDSGHEEAFWKVLHRCQGEIIGTCLSDEQLFPEAVAHAVERFHHNPTVGVFTGDGHTIDDAGNITGKFDAGEFSLISYFFSTYCPFWPGTFFRRQALLDIGLNRPGWNLGCLEFNIWCRLGTDHVVKHVAERVSNYTVHPGQLSNTPRNFHVHIDNRLKVIEQMFSAEGFFGDDALMKLECMINQISLFENHTRAYKMTEESAAFTERIRLFWREIARIGKVRGTYRDLVSHERRTRMLGRILAMWGSIARTVPASARSRIPRELKLFVYSSFVSSLFVLAIFPLYLRQFAIALFTWRWRAKPSPLDALPSYTRYYPRIAAIYDSRGQIEQALEMWRCAEALQDPMVDALACQAMLKLPEATYASIAELQRHWAKRHAQPTMQAPPTFRPLDGKRRIRIGYHCSFMSSDTISVIMRHAFAAHDRSKFEIFGYAPTRGVSFKSAFDVLRDTEHMPEGVFLNLVRRDEIDVFVELSGFSPGHRYGAMASRCAPVQVSCLNHMGTTCVPNVDYVLSDALCTPTDSGAQEHFTEQIYNLPDCLLCYDYNGMEFPPVADSPSLKSGTVTFGCFGSGGKINLAAIEMWANLLKQVPHSSIFLKNPQLTAPDNRRYLVERFLRFGIDPERILIEGGSDRLGLLKAYDRVDISLDTWPYCGGNTVAESLWQGVPVVTLLGERFSSRYGASLLRTVGCEELIGTTPEEYLSIASELAQDPERLSFLRHNLRRMYEAGGLGNSQQYARRLENAYLDMLAQKNLLPRIHGASAARYGADREPAQTGTVSV